MQCKCMFISSLCVLFRRSYCWPIFLFQIYLPYKTDFCSHQPYGFLSASHEKAWTDRNGDVEWKTVHQNAVVPKKKKVVKQNDCVNDPTSSKIMLVSIYSMCYCVIVRHRIAYLFFCFCFVMNFFGNCFDTKKGCFTSSSASLCISVCVYIQAVVPSIALLWIAYLL